jgi:hypothetical protein
MDIFIFIIDPTITTIQGITFCFLFLHQGKQSFENLKTKSSFQSLSRKRETKMKSPSGGASHSIEFSGANSTSNSYDNHVVRDNNIINLK